MPHLNAKSLLISASLLATVFVQAEVADGDKPINAAANSSEHDQKNGRHVLNGKVEITQGTLSLVCDQAVLQETRDGEQTVHAVGKPVKFRQKMEGQNVWLDGKADKLDYDSKSGEVVLAGNAWVKRGEDETNASTITYNTATEVYRTIGTATVPAGADGRVKMVIQPKKKPAESPAKP